jgi:long-chain acyl-CoA synthetase
MEARKKNVDVRIWQQKYPKGVPFEIDAGAYRSIVEVFETTCRKFAPNPCFSNLGKTLSFQELEIQSRAFAAYLQSLPGIEPGDRIAIQLPNLLQFPIALFGALRAGLVVVNTNPLYTSREMEHQFKDSGAKILLICANFAKQLEPILSKTSLQTVIVTEIGDALPAPKRWLVNSVIKYVKKMVPQYHLPKAVSYLSVMQLGKQLPFKNTELSPEKLAFIQYTGGTTGVSKGAMLTHRNLIANMEQIAAWLRPTLKEGQDVCLTPLPLYHVFSLSANAMALFKYGTHNVLITNPRDLKAVISDMRRYKLTLMTGVNTLFNALMNHPDFEKVDFSSMKYAVGGAMALQKNVTERWNKLTGSILIEGYGLTEASPVVCVNSLTAEEVRIGSVGLPLPSTEIKLINEEGKEAPTGESGEIWVRGPQVMQGYWQQPEETKKVLPGEGWLRTGDIGQFSSDGFLKIVDRQKDMIIVSGFKVFPNEVEEVLASHPKVLEVGVVGIADEHSGEVVKAFVVRKDTSLTEAQLREYAKQYLTAYKVPKHIEFRDALPKTNVGKILRRELR